MIYDQYIYIYYTTDMQINLLIAIEEPLVVKDYLIRDFNSFLIVI